MARIIKHCNTCGKKSEEVSHEILPIFKCRIIKLSCGHVYTEKIEEKKNWESMEALFGPPHKLRKFQGEGYEFARNSGFRCLIADEPGVGKTLQPFACIKFHPEILTPALIVVKSALKLQFQKVAITWLGMDYMPEIIDSSTQAPSGFSPIVITTYDILWRIQKKQEKAKEEAEKAIRARLGISIWTPIPAEEKHNIPEVKNAFKEFGFKSIWLDECQQIKNPTSKRTQMVTQIAENIPHVFATSGTPIKNHAGEYFPILHILRPELFPNYKRFALNDCDTYWNGRTYKVGGIRDLDAWKAKTGDFIIRRTRAEVLPDLPKLDRKFVDCDFASDKIKDAYRKEQEEFEELYNDMEDVNSFENFNNILAKMSKLRHLAGLNKVPFAVDFIEEFLTGTDRKVVIFVHHQDVGHMLQVSLNATLTRLKEEDDIEIAPVSVYTASLNSDQRQEVVENFIKNDKARVLIASTKAMGEGVDGLQHVCQDYIMLERQWTPTDEEQCEGRFVRFGAESGSVSGNYIISTGTIDEFFTELVEKKRAILAQTLDGQEMVWDETSLMKELAETLAKKGSKQWKL